MLKGKLKRARRPLRGADGRDVKVFVDTAPVMEKPLAAAAGLGWQGKHTNLVSREFGSWLFLGAILTELALPPDAPRPTTAAPAAPASTSARPNAFPAPYQLDARRCISYLTIEHDGPIPREFRKAMGNRIYGCDDCLAVCPWNKFAQATREAKLAPRDDLAAPPLAELAALDDAAFRARFLRLADQAHRPRPLRAQRADRHRQFGERLSPTRRKRSSAMPRRCRGAAVWALSSCCRPVLPRWANTRGGGGCRRRAMEAA